MTLVDATSVLAHKRNKEREECEESLLLFLSKGWKHIDPAKFVNNWHLEAIAEHLQAVTDGQIQRLVINIPPRTSKSSICSVAWPAWTWCQSQKGPLSGPQVQFLSASYAHTLSLRDSVKTRRLIQSPWYQGHWGSRFKLTGDVNTKTRFENDQGGYRIATSVDGTTTGEGGDVIIVDDPHKAGQDAESEVVRVNTLQWWDEVMSTRLNNQNTGAFVIVMQRLHMEDLTGHVLSRQQGSWVHLMLPMEYESSRRCTTYVQGEKFWQEPREEENELLCEARFNTQVVENLKRDLGPYAAAGQLQQAPAPRGGGLIKDEWWQHWTEKTYPQCEFVVASLDTAYTEKNENDFSALSIWGVFRHDSANVIPMEIARAGSEAIEAWYVNQRSKVIMLYQWQERLNFPDLVKKVLETCTLTPSPLVKTRYRFRVDKLLIENKAAGISVSQELARHFGFNSPFGIELVDPRKFGDKIGRLVAVQHLFADGTVYVPWPTNEDGTESPNGYKWVEDAMDEMGTVPKSPHDDFCFVAGTLIATRRGPIPIEQIEVGEEVFTPIGWRRVLRAGFTGVRLVISKFGLTGTLNHPVFSIDSGYAPLDSVTMVSLLSRLSLCDLLRITLQKRLNLMALSTAGWAGQEDIISRNPNRMQEERKLKGFMWQFGNSILARQCQKAMKSIIKTTILSTSCLRIWSAYRKASIVVTLKMWVQSAQNIWRRFDPLQLFGTDLPRVVSGIENMPMNQYKVPLASLMSRRSGGSENVHGAGNHSTTKARKEFIVQQLVRDMPANSGLENANLAPVFNLTVEGAHCYYANGILVHNCDSATQALRWLRDTGILQRPEEHARDVRDDMTYHPTARPLYPV